MDKKYGILAMILMFGGSVVNVRANERTNLALSAKEEDSRRELLCSLNKANSLNAVQCVEFGINKLAIVDRDIALMQKHAEKVLASKKSAEGFVCFSLIPGFLKAMKIQSIVGLLGSSIVTSVGSYQIYNIWNGSVGQQCAEKALRAFSGMDFMEFYVKKLDYLAKQNNSDGAFLREATPFIFAAGVLVVIEAVATKVFSSVYRAYVAKNDAFIKEMQGQFDQDQAVIAQLKEIKYSLQG
jgi:hypothetical protein